MGYAWGRAGAKRACQETNLGPETNLRPGSTACARCCRTSGWPTAAAPSTSRGLRQVDETSRPRANSPGCAHQHGRLRKETDPVRPGQRRLPTTSISLTAQGIRVADRRSSNENLQTHCGDELAIVIDSTKPGDLAANECVTVS